MEASHWRHVSQKATDFEIWLLVSIQETDRPPQGFTLFFCYRWLLLYCLHHRKHGHRYFSWQGFILFYLIHVTSRLLFPCHIFSGGSDRSCPDKTLLFEISPDISSAPVGTLSNQDVQKCIPEKFCVCMEHFGDCTSLKTMCFIIWTPFNSVCKMYWMTFSMILMMQRPSSLIPVHKATFSDPPLLHFEMLIMSNTHTHAVSVSLVSASGFNMSLKLIGATWTFPCLS